MPNEKQDEKQDEKRYVLVIKSKWVAYGPFHTHADAEYAAMDYYGTAITGASAKDAFLIAELRDVVPLEGAWSMEQVGCEQP
jgi:hypothetical protein